MSYLTAQAAAYIAESDYVTCTSRGRIIVALLMKCCAWTPCKLNSIFTKLNDPLNVEHHTMMRHLSQIKISWPVSCLRFPSSPL